MIRNNRVVLMCMTVVLLVMNYFNLADELQYLLPELERCGVRGIYAGLFMSLLFLRDVT